MTMTSGRSARRVVGGTGRTARDHGVIRMGGGPSLDLETGRRQYCAYVDFVRTVVIRSRTMRGIV